MIKENNPIEAWKKSLSFAIENGKESFDSDNNKIKEIFNFLCIIKSSDSSTKPMDIINRLNWCIYPSPEELKSTVLTNKKLPLYDYTYGPRIFNFSSTIDQINDYVVPLLQKYPKARSAFVIVWDPEIDSRILHKDIPGIVMFHFRLSNKKLHIHTVIRNNDLFTGLPSFIFISSILQDLVAGKLGVEKGSISLFSSMAYVYDEYMDKVKEVLKK